jgi:DNA-binding IclR family transcriptional regulator
MEAKIKSLQRALKILECFTINEPELGVTEISQKLNMHKSTVFNIINTFQDEGYLVQNKQSGKYRLGLKILQLGHGIYSTHDIRLALRPFLQEISTNTGESVYLGLLSDHEVIYIDALFPAVSISVRNIIGLKAPLHCTGLGKALLASLPESVVDEVVTHPLTSHTPYTITDKEKLLEELQITKQRGYSIDNMEHEYGIKCVGIAIQNIRKEVVCAVSISGPSLRFDDQKITQYAEMLYNLKKKSLSVLF